MTNNLSLCALEVKNKDYYRYICCLFTPENLRERLFTLYAFNNEITKIKEITSEPMTGLIRLTWWREAIDDVYRKKPIRNHEILKSLAELIQTTNIPQALFEKILDQHEIDINLTALESSKELEFYIDGTSIALLEASLYAIGLYHTDFLEIVQNIGKAYALIGIMRRARWDTARGHIMFPKDLLEKYSITSQEIVDGHNLEKTKAIARQLCNTTKTHLQSALIMRKTLPQQAMPIYLHAIVAKHFLSKIISHDYDLFNFNCNRGNLLILLKVFMGALRK